MRRSRGPATDGDDAFERAMRGVEPLRDRPEGAPPRRRRAASTPTPPPTVFDVATFGEQIEGLAPGVDRKRLADLVRERVNVDLTLDLHGFTEAEARLEVRRVLKRAWRSGLVCVEIVHGRGRRSPEGPVLKRALPGWLAEPPHGPRIVAFATAPRSLGGATRVLLKRRRPDREG